MVSVAELNLLITGKDNASKPLRDVGDAADGMGKKFGGLGSAIGGVATVMTGFLGAQVLGKAPALIGSLISHATELEAQAKKSSIVFGESLGIVTKWAEESANSMGLTKAEAVNLAASMGDLLIPMGMSRDAAAEMSAKTIGLAGALAEWSGGSRTAAEVSATLTKAYLGETAELKGLGISISAADISARLLAKGQEELTGQALEQAKALAIQEMVFEKSTDAQDAYAKGAGSLIRTKAELSAKFAEFKDTLALKVTPVLLNIAGIFIDKVIPVIDATVGVLGSLINYFKFTWQEGDQLNDFLSDMPEPLKGITLAIGELVVWIKDDLIPALKKVVEVIVELAQKALPPLLTALQNTIGFLADHQEILAGVAIAIGVGLVGAFTAWAISAGAAAIATIVALAPIIAIGVAIAAVAAGIIWLVKNWDDLTARYPALKDAQDIAVAAFQKVKDILVDHVIPAIVDTAKWINEYIVPALVSIGTFIWQEVIPPVAAFVAKVVEIHLIIAEKLIAIAGFFLAMGDDIAIYIAPILGKINDIGVWVGTTAYTISQKIDEIIDFFLNLKDRILEYIAPIISAIDGLVSAWDKVSGIASAVGSLGGALSGGGYTGPSPFTGQVPGAIDGYATGGMVPGPLGAARLAIVHGGEQVLTPGQQRGVTINVNTLDARSFRDWLRMGGADEIRHALAERGVFA